MQFVHQALTWGFLLVLVPLLIHLINMMRHRRVKWAAMEFLLQAYKKHRKWIWLKQLILLLMRMAAIALIVAMLAQWITRGQWLDIFGGRPTHHYVVLDDSYSMSDRFGGASAYETGLAAIQRIGAQAAAQDTAQKFTLIRFSRAARASANGGEETDFNQIADFNAEVVAPDFDVTLEEKRNTFHVTELSVGPEAALAALSQLVKQSGEENRLVYMVSDFRTGQWENPAEIRETLRQVERSPAEIQLVGCVKSTRQNLGIIDIRPANETQAAGVPLFVNVTVKNFSQEVARNVQLKVRTKFYDPDMQQTVAPENLVVTPVELPTILIEEIEAGQTVTRRSQAYFPEPGRHVIEASLPDDPVGADNYRWCVVDFPEDEPVLIVDGSTEQHHAYFLQSVFSPGGRANTGIRPEINTAAFLRDTTPEVLAGYRAIYLLDVPRLDDRAIQNLEAYVEAGGGLCFFVGPNVNLSFYTNRLHRGGEGLFPLPLARDDLLPPEAMENTPDIEVTDHPVFGVFLGERNPFIRLVTVEQYLRAQQDWRPAPDSTVQIAAFLRNRMPLAVERKFGEGRVMAMLTTLAPDWNNWGNDPSFVVVALKLQSYLASAQRTVESRPVGAPIAVQLEADKYRQDMQFIIPGETPEARLVIDRVAAKSPTNSLVMDAAIGRSLLAEEGETDRSGIYEAWPVTTAGEADVRRYALNVEPNEGDLATVGSKSLIENLDPVKTEFHYADEFSYEMSGAAGNNRSMLLMWLLLCLLGAEHVMAFFVSSPLRRGAGP
jgi:hypothetical protein